MQLALKRLVAPLVLAIAISCDPNETDFFITGLEGPGRGDVVGLVASGATPVAGAKVLISGRSPDSTDTSAGGAYSFTGLIGGAYTVTVRSATHTCTPTPVTVVRDTATTVNLQCAPRRGNLAGTVIVNSAPRSGVQLSAVQGATTVASATTDANGAYLMSQLLVGAYNVVITVPQGGTCTFTQQAVNVHADSTSRVDFSCVTTGTIAGAVTVDGSQVGGGNLAVTISQGSTVVRTLTTSPTGTYSASGLNAGTYTVAVTPPGNATCVNNPRSVSVAGDQTTTADFTCTTPVSPSGWKSSYLPR